ERLTARAFRRHRCGLTAHARAHYFFEAADYELGRVFLDDRLSAPGRRLPIDHLVWHASLHDLVLGDNDRAVRRAGEGLSPVEMVALFWRLHLAGVDVETTAADL